jgi:hypothetical protein
MINEPSDNEDNDPEYTPGRQKITRKAEVPQTSSYGNRRSGSVDVLDYAKDVQPKEVDPYNTNP